jgi:uncharacterized membrane protein YeiH
MHQILIILDFFGVAVFAVSGSLAAGRKQMDLFGVVVLASVTALGGGTIRDMVMSGGPVFWVVNPTYLVVAMIAAVVTFFSIRFFKLPNSLLLIADAIGLAVFTVLGTKVALASGTSGLVAIVMGMMSGVFGGLIRDILSGEIPLILRKEIYATASLCGALTYWLMATFLDQQEVSVIISVLVTLLIRLAATYWRLSLPIPRTSD